MKKYIIISALTISIFVSSCYTRSVTTTQVATQMVVSKETLAVGGTEEEEKPANLEDEKNKEYMAEFLDGKIRFVVERGVEVLAAEDDYLSRLSQFDYESKFGLSEQPSDEKLRGIYQKEILEWEEEEVGRIIQAFHTIENQIQDYHLRLPEEIWIINETGNIESGAAYTRGNAIVLPRSFTRKISDEDLLELVAHELFHVYSRYNKEKRPELYGIISYQQCQALKVEGELGDRLISNPDAPDMNYYINCNYKGSDHTFIPILYADRPYDPAYNTNFFRYLRDDMVEVEIIDGVPRPIMRDGEYVIVEKSELDNYYDLIGENTRYTFHPEETMADNFVLTILNKDSEVENPEILETMRSVIMK